MKNKKELYALVKKLSSGEGLEKNEFKTLIDERTPTLEKRLARLARKVRKRVYGNTVYIRGLIEISNICKNDCLYCGIRRSNQGCERYRLSKDEILDCCKEGYSLGFRTFVLQGGEDPYYTDEFLVDLITDIKSEFADCALTLSLGERSRESYAALRRAGADRYLLRHETANPDHYGCLHPKDMSYENRMRCLKDLRELGFQVGCGFMVGSPYQTSDELAEDLAFIQSFAPDMCGIGPFIPARDTPFADRAAGDAELTCYLLSILRLMHPHLLLPATTALGSISEDGREKGIISGANVVMPNLSPSSVRKKYALYNGKLSDGSEAAECLAELKKRTRKTGCKIVVARGDVSKKTTLERGK